MNKDEMIALLKRALETDSPIDILGYQGQDGSVSDFTVRLIPENGYAALVTRSIQELNSAQFRREFVKTAEDLEVANTIQASLEKSAAGATPKKQFKQELVRISGTPWWELSQESPVVRVAVEWLHRTVRQAGSGKSSTRNSRSKMREALPVGRYLQLHLDPGKYVIRISTRDVSTRASTGA